ncbi:ADP-dependent glucokinase/phosphofructokinase [Consotaella salsifontis]|uniref:ADP-dependent phosphofructokinase/glucokinase n=1 Tax=Consotaella salsifontis TaxID=1365950 RepID=A0A1T4S6N5_9HYPH|nr:ADP-dependent glucokinase/phosphofructokinase [Consotaella salsifontis]SKA23842.1 ADP-dependent phosphofructokinase/glucokinase [Consotaella salsifontis]
MVNNSMRDWAEAYAALLMRAPEIIRRSRVTLCGMSACIDARISMHDVPADLTLDSAAAADFMATIIGRMTNGVGGEIRVEWPEGPAWLAEHLPVDHAFGGTGPHAAMVLTALGAPTLLALEDRSAHMLRCVPGDLTLAEAGHKVAVRDVRPAGVARPDIFIFEFTAGRPAAGVVPPRSSRIIVRFGDPGLERDDAFEALSTGLAGEAGAGLIAGFGCVPDNELDQEVGRISALVHQWRARGLETVHLELSTYADPAPCWRLLDGFASVVTSVGMSESELRSLTKGQETASAMRETAVRLGLRRLCVHADHWAASVTLDDPAVERDALMMGCLLASARAEAGRPVSRPRVPDGASFAEPPLADGALCDGWHLVSCASPNLRAPATTLGLGDTFTAGCLLVLGGARE